MENNNETYYFPDQHVVVAYEYDGFNQIQAAGIFLTDGDETFTKAELLGYFEEVCPAYLIATGIPDVGEVTRNNYHSKLSDFILDLYEKGVAEQDVKYYIPLTLH